jgi:hypothetical protein
MIEQKLRIRPTAENHKALGSKTIFDLITESEKTYYSLGFSLKEAKQLITLTPIIKELIKQNEHK